MQYGRPKKIKVYEDVFDFPSDNQKNNQITSSSNSSSSKQRREQKKQEESHKSIGLSKQNSKRKTEIPHIDHDSITKLAKTKPLQSVKDNNLSKKHILTESDNNKGSNSSNRGRTYQLEEEVVDHSQLSTPSNIIRKPLGSSYLNIPPQLRQASSFNTNRNFDKVRVDDVSDTEDVYEAPAARSVVGAEQTLPTTVKSKPKTRALLKPSAMVLVEEQTPTVEQKSSGRQLSSTSSQQKQLYEEAITSSASAVVNKKSLFKKPFLSKSTIVSKQNLPNSSAASPVRQNRQPNPEAEIVKDKANKSKTVTPSVPAKQPATPRLSNTTQNTISKAKSLSNRKVDSQVDETLHAKKKSIKSSVSSTSQQTPKTKRPTKVKTLSQRADHDPPRQQTRSQPPTNKAKNKSKVTFQKADSSDQDDDEATINRLQTTRKRSLTPRYPSNVSSKEKTNQFATPLNIKSASSRLFPPSADRSKQPAMARTPVVVVKTCNYELIVLAI